MKKGHRRTQSAFIAPSNDFNVDKKQTNIAQNEVMMLVQASNNKVQSKVINYEKLQVNNQSSNSYLKFGNETLKRYNIEIQNKQQKKHLKISEQKLNAIPETNKSSQISSQNMSHGPREQQIPANAPKRKLRAKQVSDFPNINKRKHKKTNSALQYSPNLNQFQK